MPSPTPPAAALLLAPGPNPRMASRHPKVTHSILGKPVGRYTVDVCRALGVERILVATPEDPQAVRAALGEELEYVHGSREALFSLSAEALEGVGTVLVLSASAIGLSASVLAEFLEAAAGNGEATTVAVISAADDGTDPYHGEAYGVAALLSPSVLAGMSADATLPESQEFDLLACLPDVDGEDEAQLYRLTDPLLIEDRHTLLAATVYFKHRLAVAAMDAGVTLEHPDSIWIGPDVVMGQDTVIRPNTYLEGNCVIGTDCVIGPNVQLKDCRIGDGVTIHNAVLAESEVGDGTKIGPYAQLRPGSRVKRKVKIGNFVELKNAEVEDRVSLGHFAYIGDAFVGERTNIGAGTITCNYDGKKKHQTHIGKEAFIGTHSTLVAPVTIGDGAFTAAGSVITQDVPEDALAVGRSRQSNKPEWARKRREIQASK